MEITTNGNCIALCGMLDTTSAPSFQKVIDDVLASKDAQWEYVLDLNELQYTSSQGLRLIISLHRGLIAQQKRLTIRNVQPAVREVLDMTGLSNILTIE